MNTDMSFSVPLSWIKYKNTGFMLANGKYIDPGETKPFLLEYICIRVGSVFKDPLAPGSRLACNGPR